LPEGRNVHYIENKTFWLQEALALSGGQDAGDRGRAGFLQFEPFPICSTGLAWVRGRGQFSCSLVLSSVGRWCPARNLALDREPKLRWGEVPWGGGEERAEGSISLISWVPSERRVIRVSPADFKDDRFA